jgi:hypothetical protein
MSRAALEFARAWLSETEDVKDVPPVALADRVDFAIADEVLAELGTAPGADLPQR